MKDSQIRYGGNLNASIEQAKGYVPSPPDGYSMIEFSNHHLKMPQGKVPRGTLIANASSGEWIWSPYEGTDGYFHWDIRGFYFCKPDEGTCPKCQNPECSRDEVHNGIGMFYGPWGCGNCGWSEDSRYDFSEGKKPLHPDGDLDQWGGLTPHP